MYKRREVLLNTGTLNAVSWFQLGFPEDKQAPIFKKIISIQILSQSEGEKKFIDLKTSPPLCHVKGKTHR